MARVEDSRLVTPPISSTNSLDGGQLQDKAGGHAHSIPLEHVPGTLVMAGDVLKMEQTVHSRCL